MPSVAWADGSITPSKPKTGDGSAGSPYQISNKEELYWFAGLVNGDKSVCFMAMIRQERLFLKVVR